MRVGKFLELGLRGGRQSPLVRDVSGLRDRNVGHVELYPGPQKAAGFSAGEAAAEAEAGLGALG